ncbi:MAG: hypothetical protein ABS76_15770 [Pelagibacterium sp. SCN 64-44]|nr:MAG: hypothetical protein ABS76_15770 [Pelagibacterium sp. SCN 64-44]
MFQDAIPHDHPVRSAFDWHDVRFIGAMAGRYALTDRKPADDGRLASYACRLCSISTRIGVFVAPVVGVRGEAVLAHVDAFGMLRGTVVRALPKGFVMNLALSEAERDRLGGRIVWQKKRVHEQVPDKRDSKRVLPREPRTMLTLADGRQVPCFVIDISRSGVAVSADLVPALGTPMALGKLVGRVVRHFDIGFALQFVQLYERDMLEAMMAPPES